MESTSSGHALILDIDAQRCGAIAEVLKGLGYSTTHMQGVGAALAVCARVPFSFVLLGNVPHDQDRPTVCRALRQMTNAALIALVADSHCPTIESLLDAGASDVLPAEPLDVVRLELRVRVAERRSVAQSQAEAMLRALPDLVFRIAADGYFLAFHAARTHELYAPTDRIVGRQLEQVLPLDFARRARTAMGRALESGERQVLTYSLELPHGTRHFEARLTPSGPDEVLAVVRNITDRHQAEILERSNAELAAEVAERRRAEGALRASEAQWRSLVESSPDYIVTIDPAGLITFVNHPIPGAGAAGGVGLTVFEIAPAAAHERIRSALARAFERAEPDAFEIDGEPGTQTGFEIRLAPIACEGGVQRAVLLAHDVTQRRAAEADRARMQERLLTAQKLDSLGLLAGGIAHDFNNLLTAILGSASVALLKLPADGPARTSITTLVAAARRASELTQQLLAYSGRGKFQVRAIDLSAHIRELVLVLEAAIPKQIELRLRLDPKLPAVQADVGQIQQVVMNLVINAAEAIGERTGLIVLTTGRQRVDENYVATLFPGDSLTPGDHVCLEIHDDGCGMDSETVAKVFDPFFTTKTTGRGLGLAAVLGIIRSHHGALKIYSTPDRGTTFKVLLPACENVADSEPRESVPPVTAGGTVLVVDDESLLRRAARQIIEHFGYTALEAVDGNEAVAIYRDHWREISVVLLDMTMPGLSGEETFQALRRIRPDVCVVLSSGYNEIEATRRFIGEGLAAFLQKPYTAEQLGRCLAGVRASRAAR